MAIDQEIERKVNAYRNNPQALMQRYQQNQQLIDLLALQKLKSEKDSAAKEMQMQMAQDPQTIKQQRERELLDRTKQDMVQQQAGIMQMAQQRQQKNMQQVAKQGAASPQQVQQVASGLGALAQRQAPIRMAAGGIVAFREGGEITYEDILNYRVKNRLVQGRYLDDAAIREIIRKERAGQAGAAPEKRAGVGDGIPEESKETLSRYASSLQTAVDSAESRPLRTAPLEATLEDQAAAQADTAGPMGAMEGATPATTMTPGREGAGGMGGLPSITSPTIAPTSKEGGAGDGILNRFGLTGANAGDETGALNNARDDAAVFLGRDAKQERFDKLTGRLEEFDRRYSDPKREREDQISAFLRGTAGGGSFGTTMAGGSAGMASEKEKQYTNARQRMEDIIGLNKAAIEVDTMIAGQAQRSGDAAANRAASNAQQAAQIAATMTRAEMDQAYREAELMLRAEESGLDAVLRQAEVEAQNDLRLSIEAQGNQQASLALLERNANRQSQIMESIMGDFEYQQLLNEANKTNDPEDIAAAQRKKDQLILSANIIMNRAGLFDVEKILYERLGMPYNRPGTGVGSGSGQVDSEIEALIQQYSD